MLELDALRVSLPVGDGSAEVLHGVSLEVAPGESVAIVGESGSGKSLTARAIVRLLPDGAQVEGSVRFKERDIYAMNSKDLNAWRAEEVGFVFQDPRAHINPVRTIGDFLTEALKANRGVPAKEAEAKMVQILRDVDVSRPVERMRQYPHELSGGLLQRMMIASVLAMEPDLIIADEPTTALDVTTQSEVMAILEERRQATGLSLLLITHDLELAAAVCDRTMVLYAGWVLEEGRSSALHDDPHHPYTAGLVASRPFIEGNEGRLVAIPGRPLSAIEAISGCPFMPRCRHAIEECGADLPRLTDGQGGRSACIRTPDIDALLRAEVARS